MTPALSLPGAELVDPRSSSGTQRSVIAVPSVTVQTDGSLSNTDTSSTPEAPTPTAPQRTAPGVHFSSARGDWRTPPDLFRRLDEEFAFDLDVAATPQDRLIGARHEGWDALDGNAKWGESNYINPPYGRDMWRWMQRAVIEAQFGKQVVLLLPARTDTHWWTTVMSADEVRFIKGRIKFLNHEGVMMTSAPFPSCIVVFRPWPQCREAGPKFSMFRW